MAEKAEFLQAIDDAILDADSLERFINGDDTQDVLTRLSKRYPTLQKALKELFENGGIAGRFKTLSELQSSSLVDGDYALVADDADEKNGIYIKEGGAWVKSAYDPVALQHDIANTTVVKEVAKYLESRLHDGDIALDKFVDNEGKVYRYTDTSGHVYVPNLLYKDESLQDNINKSSYLAKSMQVSSNSNLIDFTDDAGSIFAYFDDESVLHLSKDIMINKRSVAEALNKTHTTSDTSKIRHEMMLLSTQKEPMRKELTVDDYSEDNLIKRMPFGIKTDYGLLIFYHHQVEGYNGDSTGTELWKAIVDIDSEYNMTLRSKELFKKTDAPIGIVKHPMLGRTVDGKILLCFEMTENFAESTYEHYQCVSGDEGITFTDPVLMQFTNSRPADRLALGTTGTILTLSSGRLVLPMAIFGASPFTAYSDDNGSTWRYGDVIQPLGQGYEPSITVDANGDLLMDTRPPNSDRKRKRFRSYDEGVSWVRDTKAQELTSGINQGSTFYDDTTGILLQTHTVATEGTSRNDFKLSLSYNNAITYPYFYQIHPADKYTGYSQIIKFDEGVYVIIAEYSTLPDGAYSQQNAMALIINLQEIISNVSYY